MHGIASRKVSLLLFQLPSLRGLADNSSYGKLGREGNEGRL
jgi:hypothetical protein